jgi:RimJ/RimL family protein N-acetyltransferase
MEILKDGNIRCRPIVIPEDVAVAETWYQDAEVLFYSEGEGTAPYDREIIERMYRYLLNIGEVYIIEFFDGENWIPIGDVTLSQKMVPIVIGDNNYRSIGLGHRVMKLMIERAKTLGWEKLRANKIYIYNERSRKLFERLGFVKLDAGIDERGRPYESFELNLV